ncbi:methionine aminopeptidase, type II [Vittaforma corneae ATCC 50505]|uniref:Methionine aminopeptidase, type II n=1 Tax=Vittaforma corneae (strain ATCC 50505) TaxID=993615 RepID=L2GLS4_VITCO|nr:methionine aminopeptidase, type II [Vittaforma corneae ATCC 50505]ELA41455.1 methionine aminopeptidase, type II [Vittaforma corneae ATCC 50505]
MSFVLLNKIEPQPIEFLEPASFNLTSDSILNDALRAAEAHRRVRSSVQQILKPGVSLLQIIETVEKATRALLVGEKNNGIGFPCGVSLNDCAAHFTLNPGDRNIILKESDILKIDFGTHSNGRIMDSAFTVCFDPKFEQLLKASQEATKRGLEVIGIDMMVCEIGREISEVFKSFEIELDNKIMPIKPIWNLNGHSIEQYRIHGEFSIPPINNGDTSRVSEGFCAIETFASTGKGEVCDKGEASHFMINRNPPSSKIYNAKNEKVLKTIQKEFGTLPFSPRHVEFYSPDSFSSIKLLSLRKFIDPYPPLHDLPNSFVAQFEHTVYLSDTGKRILTNGNDY